MADSSCDVCWEVASKVRKAFVPIQLADLGLGEPPWPPPSLVLQPPVTIFPTHIRCKPKYSTLWMSSLRIKRINWGTSGFVFSSLPPHTRIGSNYAIRGALIGTASSTALRPCFFLNLVVWSQQRPLTDRRQRYEFVEGLTHDTRAWNAGLQR